MFRDIMFLFPKLKKAYRILFIYLQINQLLYGLFSLSNIMMSVSISGWPMSTEQLEILLYK